MNIRDKDNYKYKKRGFKFSDSKINNIVKLDGFDNGTFPQPRILIVNNNKKNIIMVGIILNMIEKN